MKRLMAERGVARFLVAASGFGKTSLALEYAESIFGFRNTYWIDCKSHCFLRDLDGKEIANTLIELGERGSLAVFEDVPYLDDERAETFSADIDELLRHDWEVLLTTAPAYDALADRQGDRVCLRARDLLVDDDELSETGCSSLISHASECDRVPAFVWGGDEDLEAFLRGMHTGEMPSEVQLPVFIMLALQEGTLEEVASYSRILKKDVRSFINENYPFVGTNAVDECFRAHDLPVGRVIRAFNDSFDALVRRATVANRDALLIRVADDLLVKGASRRACEAVRLGCARKRRIAWLEERQQLLHERGCIAAAQEVFDSLGVRSVGVTPDVLLGSAARLAMLGDSERAFACATRAMNHAGCSRDQGFEASLFCDACGGAEKGSKAESLLAGAAAVARDAVGSPESLAPEGEVGVVPFAAASRVAMRESPSEAVSYLRCCDSLLPCSHWGIVQLSMLLEQALSISEEDQACAWGRKDVEDVVALATEVLQALQSDAASPTYFEAILCEPLVRYGVVAEERTERAHQIDALLYSVEKQRRAWQSAMKEKERKANTRALNAAVLSAPQERVPEMHVRLFGGMEISIGGKPLDPRCFAKQKAKTLLAVLVLYRGKEIPRHELFRIMWPDSSEDQAANSFYSLWSVLRRALGGESRNCPYLVRHQSSCMIDTRFVTSDIDEFEALCKRLLFEQPDPRSWLEVFGRLQDEFECDLLPSETKNEFVVSWRNRFRTRLVDAYVTAAAKLNEIGEGHTSLWFARAAYDDQPNREDVYYELMRAHALAGQRPTAISLFMEYRSFMVDELGLDPSEKIMHLYESILASGEH